MQTPYFSHVSTLSIPNIENIDIEALGRRSLQGLRRKSMRVRIRGRRRVSPVILMHTFKGVSGQHNHRKSSEIKD